MSERAASGPAITGAGAAPGDGTAGAATVTAVRAFNRFYTNTIGLLRGKYLDTPYSLTEARILFELAQRDASEAADLRRVVDIDTGYLSRILTGFESDGLISRHRSAADGRRQVIRLTEAGRPWWRAGRPVRDADPGHAGRGPRGGPAQAARRHAGHHRRAVRVAAAARLPAPGARAGRHGLGGAAERRAVYAEEFGWDSTYEALVARIVADYVGHRDPECEAAWIAEVDGTRAGCVFCVRENAATSRLRLLLVEPWARGLGIGGRLVGEVLQFARQAGYTDITLWTNDVLADARRIYQRAGSRWTERTRTTASATTWWARTGPAACERQTRGP